MEIRFQQSPKEVKSMSTQELREAFLAEKLMQDNTAQYLYSHYDRMIIGGIKPVSKKLHVDNPDELKAAYFLERREMGIINVGGEGVITVSDKKFTLHKLDCLYVGKGNASVSFESKDANHPAAFYFLSAPAHQTYPVTCMKHAEAFSLTIGDPKTANKRTVHRYIHQQGIKSCQLVMGLTILHEGSVWNTMPAHTHTRRMEAYFYFDVPDNQKIIHLMGEPSQTRHLVVSNEQAVVSPPWSVHAGCGTSNYGFIWGMAGENYTYEDMDVVDMDELR